MELKDYREKIDGIDKELVRLFQERMLTAGEIAAFKQAHNLPVLDALREKQKLDDVVKLSDERFAEDVRKLYTLLFELSRCYQSGLIGKGGELSQSVSAALDKTPKLFPEKATVACQGVSGAYSEQACEKLFKSPSVFFVASFDAVFSAIEKGLCRYGVIPLENSTAGSVNKVYDLMMKHRFSIVRSCRIKIDHQLAALPSAKLSDIREIVSHEQALDQCSDFLQSLPMVNITRCANTALAAKTVKESQRSDLAAVCSRASCELYGLEPVRQDIQNQQNNYTRFICISKTPEIFPGADRTSLMLVLPHKQGSLYRVIAHLNALGINLNKLESRPLPDRDFEFMFYFDLDVSVYSPQFLRLLDNLDELCESFTYLGSYSEVV